MPRYPLVASVEIYEPLSGAKLDGRTSKISTSGCYIDLLNPLPKNTLVQLRILRESQAFQTWARVAYVQEGLGMGLSFFDTLEDQRRIITGWIGELTP